MRWGSNSLVSMPGPSTSPHSPPPPPYTHLPGTSFPSPSPEGLADALGASALWVLPQRAGGGATLSWGPAVAVTAQVRPAPCSHEARATLHTRRHVEPFVQAPVRRCPPTSGQKAVSQVRVGWPDPDPTPGPGCSPAPPPQSIPPPLLSWPSLSMEHMANTCTQPSC